MFLDVNQLLIFSSKFIADWKQNSAGEIFMSFILIFLLFSAHKLFKTPYFPYFRRRNPYFRRKIMRKIANFRLFPLISLFPEENRQLSLISTNFAKDPPTPGGGPILSLGKKYPKMFRACGADFGEYEGFMLFYDTPSSIRTS